MERKYSKLALARLCLSGGILAVAVVSVVASFFGYGDSNTRDVVAAGAGAFGVYAIKLLHII